jgi:hypothetical protein
MSLLRHRIPLALTVILTAFNASSPGQNESKLTWDAAAAFAAGTSSHAALHDGSITLEDHVLVEDDAPACGYSPDPSSIEVLREGVTLKKTLVITRLPLRPGHIAAMFYPDEPPQPNNGRHIIFTVNGHDIPWEVNHFWTKVPVPAAYLKAGENEILLRTGEPGTRFKTWISLDKNFPVGSAARLRAPGRSARSTDGGKTWSSRQLGVEGRAFGEYPVRLNLDAYQDEGLFESSVIDLAQNSNRNLLELPVRVKEVRVDIDKSEPPGTVVRLETRSGQSLAAGGEGWSNWAPTDGTITGESIAGRFFQYRLCLSSSRADRSPSVKGMRIRALYTLDHPELLQDYYNVKSVHYPVIRSSFSFEYEKPAVEGLRKLRADMKLDDAVRGARTEFEIMLRLKGWVARQWNWHLLRPEQDMNAWDACAIMAPGADGKVDGGFCLHYAIVLMQALQSFGIPARVVSADYSIWSGHEIVEAWSNQYGKWIFLDANFDTYFADGATGVPLNVLEMHDAFVRAFFPASAINRDAWSRQDLASRAASLRDSIPVVCVLGGNARGGTLSTYEWWNPPVDVAPYCGGYGPLVMGYLRYLPRANYMSLKTPIPVNHGRTHWGWDGYYCWEDERTPRSLEHPTFTRRASDLYWNLNQIDFRATASVPGQIHFAMSTNAPDLAVYEIEVNGKEFRTEKAAFDVALASGKNRISMRVVDSMGNPGASSSFECTYIPSAERN